VDTAFMSWRWTKIGSYVRGDLKLCCDTSGNVQNVLLTYKTEICGYDGLMDMMDIISQKSLGS